MILVAFFHDPKKNLEKVIENINNLLNSEYRVNCYARFVAISHPFIKHYNQVVYITIMQCIPIPG